jgi:hypothetical protein
MSPAWSNAWTRPAWTFNSKALTESERSLIFDQNFDQKSYLPFPAIKAPQSSVAKTKKQASPLSPFFIRSEVHEVSLKQNAPAPAPVEIAAKIAEATKASPVLQNQSDENDVAPNRGLLVESAPQAKANEAMVWIVDEVSLLDQSARAIADAEVHWIHPNFGVSSKSNEHGITVSPLGRTHSTRFIVYKEGYLPAVGYATLGQVSPVILYPESRKGPILNPLGLKAENRHLIFGKFVKSNLKPLANLFLDLNDTNPARAFYAAGPLSFFTPLAEHTGATGGFIAAHLNSKLQYLMPTELSKKEWPAATVNTLGAPLEFSLSIVESRPYEHVFSISDAVHGTPPSGVPVLASVGGQKGPVWPDEAGYIRMTELHKRPFVDLIELAIDPARKTEEVAGTDPSDSEYLNTWVNVSHTSQSLLRDVPLFTPAQLRALLAEKIHISERGIVMGTIQKSLAGRRALSMDVVDSFGAKTKIETLFFDESVVSQDNSVKFAIPNIRSGEWHLVLRDAKTQKVLGVEVVRTKAKVVSQVGF